MRRATIKYLAVVRMEKWFRSDPPYLHALHVGGVPAVDISRVGVPDEILSFALLNLRWKRCAGTGNDLDQGERNGVVLLALAQWDRYGRRAIVSCQLLYRSMMDGGGGELCMKLR